MTSSTMIDEELRNATLRGDIEYLKMCVKANKPINYYMTFFPLEDNQSEKHHHGNIFHLAAMENREEFIREAIGILPLNAMQQLLIQPGNGHTWWNPLHKAAKVGNIEIVKMFLDLYRHIPTSWSQRPWLQETFDGYTPCHVAVSNNHEDCALEILKMDMELICNVITIANNSLVCEAVSRIMTKLALEILRSPYYINCIESDGSTTLHLMHLIEGLEGSKEIFRLLLQREPKLIKRKTACKNSAFHSWSYSSKMWPFKVLLECKDIIQDVDGIFRDLVSSTNIYGDNPLHTLAEYTACQEDAKKIVDLLIDNYKTDSSSLSNKPLPWLAQNSHGDTPLSLAIIHKNECMANYILSVDENAVVACYKNVLFLAVENKCHTVAEKILKIVDKRNWTQLLTNDQKLNVLHLAPLCTDRFCAQLIEGHPNSIKEVNREGFTIVHSWIKSDQKWLFRFIVESKWKVLFVKLIDAKDYNDLNNPFHVAMYTTHEATNHIVQLLVEAYKASFLNWELLEIHQIPWFEKNKKNEGPLHLALHKKREDLALYILSLLEDDPIDILLDYYTPEHSTLFLAIQNNCSEVAKAILKKIDNAHRNKYLKDSSTGQNILHLATSLTDKEFGIWLVKEASEFITEHDNNQKSPWDTAYENGSSWFIKAVLEKDPSMFNNAPLAWIKSCEKGYVSTLCTFIEHNPGAFRDLCIDNKDSPLHHIQLTSLTECEEFILKVPHMKDLINLQDSQGATPLHRAIQSRKKYLTETLLNMEKIDYNIKDMFHRSATDLLAQVCKEDNTWEKMCQRIGFDPWIKTSYFQRKTNLLDVRSSLFVVAALLATITFTAGFTLPGGLKQETGEALLAKKVAFLVFLMSNTLAMCTSMLVLICLVWSMVQESSKSLLLIDRSMVLLMVAFYSTIFAFMTGVYTVISSKVLWASIIIIIMCSLIGISASRTLLYKVLLISSAKKKQTQRDPMYLLELGKGISCCEASSKQKVE